MGKDGTEWTVVQGEERGRRQSQNVVTETEGLAAYAKRRISDALTAFKCLVDEEMLEEIRDCTVTEARRVLEDDTWDMSLAELQAFMSAPVRARGKRGEESGAVQLVVR